MRPIDADAIVFDYNGLAYIGPYNYMDIAKYFADQIARQPPLTPPNEPLTLEELREMGGQPYWHVGLREESPPPHWNILDPFCAKRIEDYKYGENWIAYRRPPEGEADA